MESKHYEILADEKRAIVEKITAYLKVDPIFFSLISMVHFFPARDSGILILQFI